ncbi:hypothetical protein M5K25_005532 [Dendrobium thyrsiflorum]|uniref:Uncharacterized protein n=1 Tax=Dendrobium thyrsiflorum TaxID=117978 RepID=A0ABD0VPZ6_DENTH
MKRIVCPSDRSLHVTATFAFTTWSPTNQISSISLLPLAILFFLYLRSLPLNPTLLAWGNRTTWPLRQSLGV